MSRRRASACRSPRQAFDLSRYANIAFLEKLDSAIKHQTLHAADAVPNKEPTSAHNRPQGRNWCEDAAGCFQSRYQFEGRIPTGILLVNKLRDETKKPIPDFIEFQSEMRVRSPNDPQMSDLGARSPESKRRSQACSNTAFSGSTR